MPDPQKPIVNISDVPLRDFGQGEKFSARLGRIAAADYWDGEAA